MADTGLAASDARREDFTVNGVVVYSGPVTFARVLAGVAVLGVAALEGVLAGAGTAGLGVMTGAGLEAAAAGVIAMAGVGAAGPGVCADFLPGVFAGVLAGVLKAGITRGEVTALAAALLGIANGEDACSAICMRLISPSKSMFGVAAGILNLFLRAVWAEAEAEALVSLAAARSDRLATMAGVSTGHLLLREENNVSEIRKAFFQS